MRSIVRREPDGIHRRQNIYALGIPTRRDNATRARKNFAKSEIRAGGGRGREYCAGNAGTVDPGRGGREGDNVYSDIASQRVYGEVTHHPRIVSLNGISI